ncbi:MAG: threonylcarbamoyl-AMP synthase, partial [Candidatus Dadabacteria bacterium]
MKVVKASKDSIKEASLILKRGGVVVFPTETVYGLGASAFSDKGVEKIFQIKRRPRNNPLIVHILSFDAIEEIAKLSLRQKEIVNALKIFTPGPLTVVVPSRGRVSKLINAGQEGIACRVPSHPAALKLIEEAGALAAPSANLSGRASPVRVEDLSEEIVREADLVLDGGRCKGGIESTVLSLLDDVPKILRQGLITKKDLEEVLSCKVSLDKGVEEKEESVLSPGRIGRHYAPLTPIKILPADTSRDALNLLLKEFSEDSKIALLTFKPPLKALDTNSRIKAVFI